jgi:hypothetical protein
VLVQFPHYITPKEKSVSKSYAKKIGAKQYHVDSNTKKNSKTLFKREPRVLELKWTSLYSTNMTWKQDQPEVNFYHKYYVPMSTSSLKNHFYIHGLHLEHGRDYLRCLLNVCYYQHVDSLKMIEDTQSTHTER